MDSLLASYASSDEEEEQGQQHPQAPQNPNPAPKSNLPPPSRSLLSSLPPPKSTPSTLSAPKSAAFPPPSAPPRSSESILPPKAQSCSLSSKFRALPPPESKPSSSSPSIFSSLPSRKSESGPDRNRKRVVQFRPPLDPSVLDSLDEDEDGGKREKEKKPVKDSGSRPFSLVLPPPQHSFSSVPSGRRTIVEAGASEAQSGRLNVGEKGEVQTDGLGGEDKGGGEEYGGYYGAWGGGSEVGGQWSSGADGGGVDASGWVPSDGGYYENYANYGGDWGYGAMEASMTSEVAAPAPEVDLGRIMGKRGRKEIPSDMLEVKQEELVKDRPREDQAKATGIAFGPAYQPVSAQKGKPSKLHKRKHQIGSLYFDMRQKEMELTERRARGMLTKRETQGKYGW